MSPKELMFRAKQTLERAAAEGVRGARGATSLLEDGERSVSCGEPLCCSSGPFQLFQLAQASARVEGYGIPAKGLTGRGYEGHYFWDARFTSSFLVHTAPALARISCAIVIVCWTKPGRGHVKSTSEGPVPLAYHQRGRASAYYAAGTAQYHINADIAYALVHYVQATNDTEFRLNVELRFGGDGTPVGGSGCVLGT